MGGLNDNIATSAHMEPGLGLSLAIRFFTLYALKKPLTFDGFMLSFIIFSFYEQ